MLMKKVSLITGSRTHKHEKQTGKKNFMLKLAAYMVAAVVVVAGVCAPALTYAKDKEVDSKWRNPMVSGAVYLNPGQLNALSQDYVKDDDKSTGGLKDNVVWHFVLNQLDDNSKEYTLVAEFTKAGEKTCIAQKDSGGKVQHFYIGTNDNDTLEDAWVKIANSGDVNGKLLLSHTVIQGTPTDTVTPTPTDTTKPTDTVTPTPTDTTKPTDTVTPTPTDTTKPTDTVTPTPTDTTKPTDTVTPTTPTVTTQPTTVTEEPIPGNPVAVNPSPAEQTTTPAPVTVTADPIPGGSANVPSTAPVTAVDDPIPHGAASLPNTGEVNPGVFTLSGLSVIITGLMLRKNNRNKK